MQKLLLIYAHGLIKRRGQRQSGPPPPRKPQVPRSFLINIGKVPLREAIGPFLKECLYGLVDGRIKKTLTRPPPLTEFYESTHDAKSKVTACNFAQSGHHLSCLLSKYLLQFNDWQP